MLKRGRHWSVPLFAVLALAIAVGVALFAAMQVGNADTPPASASHQDDSDARAVRALVEDFGRRLQLVSLLAPRDLLAKTMQENYGDLVASPDLIATWLDDPLHAPGRLTSSPWPDRIEITGVQRLSEHSFKVEGQIIEITSTEMSGGGVAAQRPITLMVEKVDGRWLISDVKVGEEKDTTQQLVYRNDQYGFSFSLPASWKDYQIITSTWEGYSLQESRGIGIGETGPVISIRHPLWASQEPRQDIPIMVFTVAQWNSLQREEFHIGAAPIGPRELGRNAKYVFALPARYNYAFPTGYEEVEEILNSNPLQAND